MDKEIIIRRSRVRNKQNKHTHLHINDKYLGEGSFGCVISPEVKCNSKENIINNQSNTTQFVSKIFTEKENYEKEVNASKVLKTVDKTGKNILLPYKNCEITSEEVLKNKQATNCEELEFYKNKKTHHLYQLIMPYGGIRYDTYFEQHKPSLKEFFSISEPLFKALLLLEEKKICHYDIRGANVLIGSNKKAIIIDHSLIITFAKLYHSSNIRRLKKSYYPYPPECIAYYKLYMNNNKQDSYSDEEFIYNQFNDSINSYGERRYEAYISLINEKTLYANIDVLLHKLKEIVKNNKTNHQSKLYEFMEKYANKLDVYSVGMLIVTVYKYINYNGVSKKIKDEFIKFIKQLIDPNVITRVTPKEAYEIFTKLNMQLK